MEEKTRKGRGKRKAKMVCTGTGVKQQEVMKK